MSRKKGWNENPIGGRADIRFISKPANLIIIEQGYAAAKMVEFLKMPTRIPCWY
jgi:hypothetical protein